jgi:ureidoglycolate lyase
MPLKTYQTSLQIHCQPLTPESFAPYGTVISANHQLSTSTNSSANYGTAIKLHKVSLIQDDFSMAPSGTPATANWNIFRCSPPIHLMTELDSLTHYKAKVLERHPFSSQTFLPMGVDKSKDAYVVICARESDGGMPDVENVEAFLCKADQAVTYAAGELRNSTNGLRSSDTN